MRLLEDYKKYTTYPLEEFATDECRFLYLIYNPFTNLCKIGITNNPKQRLASLECQNGVKLHQLIVLELEVEYDEPAGHIEEYLHKYFKHKRKRGEWFDFSLRDIAQIREFIWDIEGDDILDNFKEIINTIKNEKQTSHSNQRSPQTLA